jgi:hypothetical protein
MRSPFRGYLTDYPTRPSRTPPSHPARHRAAIGLVNGQDSEDEEQHEHHSGDPYGVAGAVSAKSTKLAAPDGETPVCHMGAAHVPADITGRSSGDYRYSHG